MTMLIQPSVGNDTSRVSATAINEVNSRHQTAMSTEQITSQGITQLALDVGISPLMQANKRWVNDDHRPILTAPQIERLSLLTGVSDEGETKFERLAALVSMLLSPPFIQQRSDNVSSTVKRLPPTGERMSVDPVHLPLAPEEGSGISVVTSSTPAFINVSGPMNLVAVSNILTKVLIDADRTATIQAAQASIRSVTAALRSGENTVESARRNLTGAITSGTLSSVGQGITTLRSIKALGSEAKSITQNLRAARSLELGAKQQVETLANGQGNTLQQRRGSAVEPSVSRTPAQSMHASGLKHDEHSSVQLKTAKVRLTSDYANQAIHAGKGLVEGAFSVSAATQQKEAELARTDRDINNELASTHGQVAKKNAEAKSALSNTLSGTMMANSSAFSAMADRT
ncbi:hypothetical protein [Tatumella ptyseos]|uniref:hypothetical protein n=1 Tax=Tatumella ptyseos TaxID=82987 RepID=UPI0026EE96FE|nr:hypothetical protein [Tatumella ptyseos]WKX25748.1 hypothetical protein QJR74_10540 [Tatumella ptyseos]